MTAAEAAIAARAFAIALGDVRRLVAGFLREQLDGRAGTRAQKSRPVGLDLAPELLLGPISNEGALGAIAFDEAFAVQDAERLADGGARHAIFGGQFLDRWTLVHDQSGRESCQERVWQSG